MEDLEEFIACTTPAVAVIFFIYFYRKINNIGDNNEQ